MAIPELPVSRPIQVSEIPKYVVTTNVMVTAETELGAAECVANLGRRLTENCLVLDWSFQSLKPFLFEPQKRPADGLFQYMNGYAQASGLHEAVMIVDPKNAGIHCFAGRLELFKSELLNTFRLYFIKTRERFSA